MSLMAWILAWLFPDPITVPSPRRRFLKTECLDCGRMVAHTRHGKAWRHACRPPVPPDEEPDDARVHDTWEEHRGLR